MPTISDTKADREGPSKAAATPITAATTKTCQTWTSPSSVSAASAALQTAQVDWVIMSTRRRG